MRQHWADDVLGICEQRGSKFNPPSIVIGIVKSILPLQVSYCGVPLNRSNLYINKFLLDWSETIQASTSDGSSISEIEHKSPLKIGDSVYMYEIEKNKKYILMGVIE